MSVQKIEIKQLKRRKTGREMKKDSERKGKETKTRERTYNLRQTNGEREREGSALPSSFKWMKSAPF